MSSEYDDLKQFIANAIVESERRQAGGIAALRQELLAAISNAVGLITNVKESLEREMHDEFGRINSRFDAMQARLDRQGGILQSGVKWTSRMSKWSEDIDKIILDRDKRMDRLEALVHHLGDSNPQSDAL